MSDDQLKANLIKALVSKDFGKINSALKNLRDLGWLYDGSLCNQNFSEADLYEAVLTDANFSGANFTGAILQGADLTGAKLVGTTFVNANLDYVQMAESNLEHAILDGASIVQGLLGKSMRWASLNRANMSNAIFSGDLRDTSLQYATLAQAVFVDVDLRGVNFFGAVLERALLQNVTFNSDTVLPDGIHWSQDIDMRQYIAST